MTYFNPSTLSMIFYPPLPRWQSPRPPTKVKSWIRHCLPPTMYIKQQRKRDLQIAILFGIWWLSSMFHINPFKTKIIKRLFTLTLIVQKSRACSSTEIEAACFTLFAFLRKSVCLHPVYTKHPISWLTKTTAANVCVLTGSVLECMGLPWINTFS